MIKMDTEGAESLVIQGPKNVLANNPDVVIVSEFCPSTIMATGGDAHAFLQDISGIGFSIFEIDERRGRLAPRTIEKLLQVYTVSKNNGTNLVFSKKQL